MPYTRANAVKFAEKFWNIPADDGIFWLSNQGIVVNQVRQANVIPTKTWKKALATDGWMPFFVDDSKGGEKAIFRRGIGSATEEILINPWEGIADCAHFLSRCLTAGGLAVNERGVPSLVNKLQSLQNTKTLGEKVDPVAGQRIVDSGIFKPGDMIGYFNIDPNGDYDGARQYAHSGMYAGKINGSKDGAITCHTICRFPGKSWVEDSWWLKDPGHYLYTFIHISDDDPAPDLGKTNILAGWWKVEFAGQTDFYFIQRNGLASKTKRAPVNGQAAVHFPEDSAYWFMSSTGEVTFIWRKTGIVENWTPTVSSFESSILFVLRRTLTKLF